MSHYIQLLKTVQTNITILYDDIYDFQKRFLLSMIENKPNISIKFFNMQEYIKKYSLNNLFIRTDMSLAAYYRLFIGEIFKKYEKILYLDSDLIINRDISQLFNTELLDYSLGACLDTNIANYMFVREDDKKYMSDFRNYMRNTFKYYDSRRYFNSGVLLINIKNFRKTKLNDLLDLARNNTKYFHDQNVLNVAFANDFKILPSEWNTQVHIKYYPTYRQQLPVDTIKIYDSYETVPAILHYTYHPKVWNDPYKQWANIWWKYARETPFYEIILKELVYRQPVPASSNLDNSTLSQILSYKKDKFRYYRYKLLSKITFGKMRKHYKKKRKELKQQLKSVRQFLKAK